MKKNQDGENPEIGQRLFEQALELWINPEIERRRLRDELSEDFALDSAQVIMNFDKPIEVRLNGEVRALVEGKIERPIEEGEVVDLEKDISEISCIRLTEIDSNAGHLTILRHRGFWRIHFDFRYNQARCTEHLAVAEEFLSTAKDALSNSRLRAFVDNLYSATELLAKAELIMHDKMVFESKKHGAVHSRYNQYANLGNVEKDYANLLNRLAKIRPSAKYLRTDFTIATTEGEEMVQTIESMLHRLRKKIVGSESTD